MSSSPHCVYLRKNIKKKKEVSENGEETLYYIYDEAVLTIEEYEDYVAELNNPGIQSIKEDTLILMESNADSYANSENNSIILMQAIADLYDLIAMS